MFNSYLVFKLLLNNYRLNVAPYGVCKFCKHIKECSKHNIVLLPKEYFEGESLNKNIVKLNKITAMIYLDEYNREKALRLLEE